MKHRQTGGGLGVALFGSPVDRGNPGDVRAFCMWRVNISRKSVPLSDKNNKVVAFLPKKKGNG
jgi:hypothetical protein